MAIIKASDCYNKQIGFIFDTYFACWIYTLAEIIFLLLFQVLCFHLGMTEAFIWDYKTPHQRVTNAEETFSILQEIHKEIVKNKNTLQYRHEVQC